VASISSLARSTAWWWCSGLDVNRPISVHKEPFGWTELTQEIIANQGDDAGWVIQGGKKPALPLGLPPSLPSLPSSRPLHGGGRTKEKARLDADLDEPSPRRGGGEKRRRKRRRMYS